MSRQNTQDTIRILVAPVGDEVSLVERDVSLVTPEVRSGIEGDGVATEFFRRKFSSTKCLGEEKSEISAPRAARGIHLTSKVSGTSAERPMDKRVGDSEHAIWTSTSVCGLTGRLCEVQTVREEEEMSRADEAVGVSLVEPSITRSG